jgi:hypothetical protein
MRLSRSLLMVVVVVPGLLSVAACQKKQESPPAPQPAPAQPPAAPGTPDQKPGLRKRAVLGPDDPLARMAFEALNRPTGVLEVEDVLAALKGAGIEIASTQQVVASQVHASYCVVGATKGGSGVSICEFTDDAAANAGREYSIEKLAGVRNRLFSVRKGTLLTVTTTVDPPESDVEGKKIVGVFEKL